MQSAKLERNRLMENKTQETLAMKVIATLDTILHKMSDVLDASFVPGEMESMKLLREFRSTMNSRRIWIKFCGLNDGNEDNSNTLFRKEEKTAINQPPSAKKPVIMNKGEDTILDGVVFKGIKCNKNNQIPQVDLTSGLVYRQ